MPNDPNEGNSTDAGGTTRKLPPKQAPEHSVPTYKDVPETARPERRPGPRKRFPQVPPGPDHPDDSPSPAVPPRKQALAAAATPALAGIKVLTNVELSAVSSSPMTSSIGEPSVACNGDVVFYAGNWYAAMSTDGANSFEYVNPYKSFPDPPGMRFCCDQVVHYIPSIDMFVRSE